MGSAVRFFGRDRVFPRLAFTARGRGFGGDGRGLVGRYFQGVGLLDAAAVIVIHLDSDFVGSGLGRKPFHQTAGVYGQAGGSGGQAVEQGVVVRVRGIDLVLINQDVPGRRSRAGESMTGGLLAAISRVKD